MQRTAFILLCFALIALAWSRSPKRTRPAWFQSLKGWQKSFGLVAVILAVLILINPDFLALGLLGDATFFDVLVMALSLQMLVFVQCAWRGLGKGFVRGLRWAGIPSPVLLYLLASSAVTVERVVSLVQKAAHRILS